MICPLISLFEIEIRSLAMIFLPDWHVFLQFAGAAIILILIPGPDMALIIGRAISQGKMAGAACVLGCYTSIFIQVISVAIGLSALIIASPTGFFILKASGAIYLLWLAFQALRHGSKFSIDMGGKQKQSLRRNYLAGFWMDLLNPKVLLFNMTFLPQFVQASDPAAAQKLLFLGLAFIPISLPFTFLMLFAADKLAAILKQNPIYTRVLDWVMAGIFIAFAVRLIATQAK